MKSRNVPDRNKVFFGLGSPEDTLGEINNARDEALKDLENKAEELADDLGGTPSTRTVPTIPGVVTGIGTITPVTGMPFNGILGDVFTTSDIQTGAGTGHDCRAMWSTYDKDGLLGYGVRTFIAYKSNNLVANDVYKFIAHCTDTGTSYDLGSPVAITTELGAATTREYQIAFGGSSVAVLTTNAPSKTLYLYTKAGGWTTTTAATAATGTSFNTVGFVNSKFSFSTSSIEAIGATTRINTTSTHYYRSGDTVVLEDSIYDAAIPGKILVPMGSYSVVGTTSSTSFDIDFDVFTFTLNTYGTGITGTVNATGTGKTFIGCYWAGTAGGGYAVYRTDGTLVVALGTGLGNTSMRVGGGYVWLNNGYVSEANPVVGFVARYGFSIALTNSLISAGADGFLTHVQLFTSAGITTWGWRRYDPTQSVTSTQLTLFSGTGLAADFEPWGSARVGGTLAMDQTKGIVAVRGGEGVVYFAGFLGYQAYQDPLTGLPSLPITSGPTTWVHDGVNFAILNSAPISALSLIQPGTANNGSILFSGVAPFSETGIVDDATSIIGGTKQGTGAAEWCTVSGAII
jgi:hypothetical protein